MFHFLFSSPERTCTNCVITFLAFVHQPLRIDTTKAYICVLLVWTISFVFTHTTLSPPHKRPDGLRGRSDIEVNTIHRPNSKRKVYPDSESLFNSKSWKETWEKLLSDGLPQGMAFESEWQVYECRGGQILEQMRDEYKTEFQSLWMFFDDLADNDWVLHESFGTGWTFLDKFYGSAMDDLNFMGSKTQIYAWYWDAELQELADNPVVSASYAAAYSIQAGAILELSSTSPRYVFDQLEAKGILPINSIPSLSQWADVTFLSWERFAKDKVKDINLIIRGSDLRTDEGELTLEVAERALERGAWQFKGFQEMDKIIASSEAGKALLGTPIGTGVSLFLIEHKAQLGRKEVTHIKIFLMDSPQDLVDWKTHDVVSPVSYAFYIDDC
ncbi:hypothetical protein NA57DRAFT_79946 [Rhizodiscina lignyota]|uniref:Uncharacterized protein n=1 Tax=Rhizodiscina lignyota TaxID=1504668 RepID=A0A9P4I7W4_9PEZI|nr:hypothetical protein NA57DRAFT_79946 [Rhizodiscina lignyota]